jgi:peptidoglycan hydrolase-like protein with peptidoglycan-binding domain
MRPGVAAAAAASFAMLALPATAGAVASTPSPAPAPSSTTPAPTTVPSPSAPAPPAPGKLQLVLAGLGGSASFALAHDTVVVQGLVAPFVAGQRVQVNVFRDGHRQTVRTVAVHRHGKGGGEFRFSFHALPGRMRVLAAHVGTAQQAKFTGATPDITVISSATLQTGARGASVGVLQRALGALHYAVPQSGYFDEATADAVIAYRKVTGLSRVEYADAGMLRRLSHGEGAFHVRFPQDGRHVEANLSLQVIAEIEHGKVVNIYPTSSGKPSTPTVLGRFRVYEKSPGFNSEQMYDSNYFISGYAIHGYPEVPTYAASHGCLRVPNLDAPAIYSWVQIGTPVDVYD